MFPDRISEAIEVLRISALSSYEGKRISTGALLFGSLGDACHSLPPRPPHALPYSSELTSIRSFHRICDGLRTIALVDRSGKHDLAELRSFQDWYLRYWLESVPGVAEVASLGGFQKQYQVHVDPNALLAYEGSMLLVSHDAAFVRTLAPTREIVMPNADVRLFR